jgi:hypothetical protein
MSDKNYEVVVSYYHATECRTLDEHGKWSEPVIYEMNPDSDLAYAKRRHEECKDMEHEFGRKFEGSYGYSYKNCKLMKRTVVKFEVTEPVE